MCTTTSLSYSFLWWIQLGIISFQLHVLSKESGVLWFVLRLISRMVPKLSNIYYIDFRFFFHIGFRSIKCLSYPSFRNFFRLNLFFLSDDKHMFDWLWLIFLSDIFPTNCHLYLHLCDTQIFTPNNPCFRQTKLSYISSSCDTQIFIQKRKTKTPVTLRIEWKQKSLISIPKFFPTRKPLLTSMEMVVFLGFIFHSIWGYY